MSVERRTPLILIEWVRLSCALGVVALHYGVTFWHAPSLRAWHLLAGVRYRAAGEAVFTQGWIGVELFFVISGMMIGLSVLGESRAAFLRRRLARLVPGAWICATITLVVVGCGLGFDQAVLAGWARSIAFFPLLNQIDDSYWTLGIEVSFYLCVATLIDRARPSLIGPALLIGGASAAFWGLALIGGDPGRWSGDRLLQLVLLPHGCFFALGMMLAPATGRRAMRIAVGAVMLGACTIEILQHAQSSATLTGIATPLVVPLLLFLLGLALLVAAPRMQQRLSPWCAPGCRGGLGRLAGARRSGGWPVVARDDRAGRVPEPRGRAPWRAFRPALRGPGPAIDRALCPARRNRGRARPLSSAPIAARAGR